ncbi:alpha/beta hydrolase [Pseudofrankia sp. BMG5.36]|uniref:alpha/beta hydrolase n=1 Tax=Pseudofrankia sp. BMG5.36 TaxID=1834512 RepID=UPI0008DAC0E2|nr:alpha/beta hydrolase [Pseudofrankia sp. BMG5.36]OHV43671.1 dienelactone hydrolase [Pseudofrankia sp. BMG5.36]
MSSTPSVQTTDTARVDVERVEFAAEGVPLVGELRLPADDADPAGARAIGVVLTGPFTGVKEQVVGRYAERLAAAGFATLAFDHRGFGESGGRRGHEDSQGKLADLRAAVDLLAARPEVDAERLAVVGVCLGGGYAVRAAATDPRLRAVAGIAGAYNSPAWFAERMGLPVYRSALTSFLAGYDEPIPAVAPDGGEAAMGGPEPYAYYGTARSTSPHWRNEVTRGSLHSLMTLDALSAAPLLAGVPLLIVHGRVDDYCSPELAAEMHRRTTAAGPAGTAGTPGTAEIVWLDTTSHIDLYDAEPYVSEAAAATITFLRRSC